MDIDKQLIQNQLLKLDLEKFIKQTKQYSNAKDSEVSKKLRLEGNELYRRKNNNTLIHRKILNYYSKSIAFAPNSSEELILAYGNRSALLFQLKKYEESIKDINRILYNTESISFKIKLLCRKVECLTILDKSDNHTTFQEAIKYFKKIRADDKDKTKLYKLIDKTKIFLDFKKQGVQKEENKHKFLKNVARKQIIGKESFINTSINIRYSEKYGRFLIAARDISPGEIIFVENPYVFSSTNIDVPYIYCNNCLIIAWAGIPCQFCSWCIFCSEKCLEEAWEKEHSIKCCVIPYVRKIEKKFAYHFQLCLKTMIRGIKDCKGIDKLRIQLESIDRCNDEFTTFSNDIELKSNQFLSICSLSDRIPKEHLQKISQYTVKSLIYIVKYSNFFGKDYLKLNPLSDLTINEDVLFIGALLLRLIKISLINGHDILNLSRACNNFHTKPLNCVIKKCCTKGICFAPIASLINNNCIPNSRKCFTDDQKIVIYALEPIRKHSQIFYSYLYSFYDTPDFIDRKLILENHFFFSCDCVACERNWLPLILPNQDLSSIVANISKNFLEKKIMGEYKDIIITCLLKKDKFDEITLQLLIKGIEKISKLLVQPSVVRCILAISLQTVIENIYGYTPQF